jgi:hypothetical protein
VVLLLCCIGCVGCTAEEEQGQSSHFEHDHFVPDHWPESLADASNKLRERARLIGSAEDATEISRRRGELADLVGWAPEIAADTDLGEANWLPIYERCEAWRQSLRREGWSDRNLQAALEIAALLEESAAKLSRNGSQEG